MAGYRTHLSVSTITGAAYGAVGALYLDLGWGPVFLGAGLTSLGGLLPDLDSDSGVPVRELFGMAAAFVPLLLLERLRGAGLGPEQILVILAAAYLFIRYSAAATFKRLTVHRGMFHSIPAMLIAGLAVFLLHHAEMRVRVFLGVGIMLGYLSHLVLDEIWALRVTVTGVKANQFAGSALKFASSSWAATLFTYGMLGMMGWVAYEEVETRGRWVPAVAARTMEASKIMWSDTP